MSLLKIEAINKYLLNLFSGTCILCGAESHVELDLCQACSDDLPYLEQACERCALPISKETHQQCRSCLEKVIPTNCRVFSAFIYTFPINRLITAFKFRRRLVISTVLGKLMARKMLRTYQNSPMPNVIMPVPLHTTRLRQRGFNQALELARVISRILSITLDYRSCTRVHSTQPQVSLAARERTSNVEGAFAIYGKFEGASICLIDDVYTTGSTTMAVSKLLLEAGAQSIDIWCCARTP